MSEYMSAEIWIGGKVPTRLVPQLCEAIADQGVAVEWGDGGFHPTSADDLLAARREIGAGVPLLWLCDEQARWGQFDSLELFLRRHRIAYTRTSEGKWEYEPEQVEYRPPRSLLSLTTNHAGEVVVPAARLFALADALSKIPERLTAATAGKCRRALDRLARDFHRVLPPQMPPLDAFEIVPARRRSKTHGKHAAQRSD